MLMSRALRQVLEVLFNDHDQFPDTLLKTFRIYIVLRYSAIKPHRSCHVIKPCRQTRY